MVDSKGLTKIYPYFFFILFFVWGVLPYFSGGEAFSTPFENFTAKDNSFLAVTSFFDFDWKIWFTVVIFAFVFFSLVKELLPPDIIMLIGAGIFVVTGIITPKEFLQGFSQDIIITLAMLFIIARSLEINGLINILAKRSLPKAKRSMRQLLCMMLPLSAASAFLNNTPIVLILTPIIRKWALERKMSPSKFLIPLSYATILGGTCTLIGTSSNLIVDGLLRANNPGTALDFFELSYIGIPFAIVGFLYMILIGHHLLPNRLDTTTAAIEQTREFTSEFRVEEGCVLCNETIREAGRKYFKGEYLVEIERGDIIMDSPGPGEIILSGDRLVFIGDIEVIAEIHTIKGLRSIADPHFELDVTSSHFSEAVIATTSSLVGKSLKRVNFRQSYGASVLAVYRQGKRLTGSVGDIILQPGDTLMLLSSEAWEPGSTYNNDFFYIRFSEKIALFSPYKAIVVLGILVSMVVAAVYGVPMMVASLSAVSALVMTKSISIREARKAVRWNLLVLIASAFAFGTALQTTGVANYLAQSILYIVGNNPHLLIAGIFALTMITTEVITNNAAALLLLPIAMQTARLGGFDSPEAMKAVAVTVAVSASCSFATPIGYQTNTIVYGPGGYKFTDYLKVGIPLSILFLILGTILIPVIWPLS